MTGISNTTEVLVDLAENGELTQVLHRPMTDHGSLSQNNLILKRSVLSRISSVMLHGRAWTHAEGPVALVSQRRRTDQMPSTGLRSGAGPVDQPLARLEKHGRVSSRWSGRVRISGLLALPVRDRPPERRDPASINMISTLRKSATTMHGIGVPCSRSAAMPLDPRSPGT